MLDWTRLKSYQENPSTSFEELCYQIARIKYGKLGRLLSIDDSGGGDGVEFFLELPNGAEWGWQAKFYRDGRINSTRRKSIENSLKKAVKVHGSRLKKWFLCVPLNFVIKGKTSEMKWFREQLQNIAPEVELVPWTASELFALLQESGLEGTRLCFFGDLVLSESWFVNRCDVQLSNIKEKYDSSLHTETGADLAIHGLTGDYILRHKLDTAYEGMLDERSSILQSLIEMTSSGSDLSSYGFLIGSEGKNIWSEFVGHRKAIAEAVNILSDNTAKVRNAFDNLTISKTKKEVESSVCSYEAFLTQLGKYDKYEITIPIHEFDELLGSPLEYAKRP